MASFQTRFQRLIADGKLALWMLGALPFFCRSIVSSVPRFVDEGAAAALSLDEASLGLLLVLFVALRVYGYG